MREFGENFQIVFGHKDEYSQPITITNLRGECSIIYDTILRKLDLANIDQFIQQCPCPLETHFSIQITNTHIILIGL